MEQAAKHTETEHKIDKAVEDTFPASDPPAAGPIAGTRKAEQAEAAKRQPPQPKDAA